MTKNESTNEPNEPIYAIFLLTIASSLIPSTTEVNIPLARIFNDAVSKPSMFHDMIRIRCGLSPEMEEKGHKL